MIIVFKNFVKVQNFDKVVVFNFIILQDLPSFYGVRQRACFDAIKLGVLEVSVDALLK